MTKRHRNHVEIILREHVDGMFCGQLNLSQCGDDMSVRGAEVMRETMEMRAYGVSFSTKPKNKKKKNIKK